MALLLLVEIRVLDIEPGLATPLFGRPGRDATGRGRECCRTRVHRDLLKELLIKGWGGPYNGEEWR